MAETDWWTEAIIYQLYPRSFKDSNNDGIGDINGIREKLDYIKSLGVNTLWINPLTLSNQVDNGYDVMDYKKVDPLFGTEEESDLLIKEAKERGFKLIFDLPLNHTSDQHPWFKEALKGKDNPYRHYYIWADSDGDPYPNNWKAGFGGSAWTKQLNGDQYYLHLFMENMPDLNWDHEPLRKEIADIINYWIDKGIDDFRLDALIYLDVYKDFPDHPDEWGEGQDVVENGEKLKEYLTELNERIKKKDNNIFMLGEATSADAETTKWYTENKMVDKVITLQYLTFKDEEKLEELPEDKQHVPLDLKEFKKTQKAFQEVSSDKGGPILFWSNHDLPRSPQKFGDMENYRDNTAKMMATLFYLQPGIPIIYYGEEIGMNNIWFEDPENITDAGVMDFYHAARQQGWSHEKTMYHLNLTSRDNSRGIMQWTDGDRVGFTENAASWTIFNQEETYNVKDQEADETSILNYYRQLMNLRKTDLFKKGTWTLLETKDHLYVYKRELEKEKALIVCNFSSEEDTFEGEEVMLDREVVLQTEGITLDEQSITLPPYGACVLLSNG